MSTEAELGYRDAIRQVERCLQRRMKSLQEERKNASEQAALEIRIRISEIEHVLEIVESLHR